MFATRRCFIAIAVSARFRLCNYRVQVNQDGLKLNVTHQALFYANVSIYGKSVQTAKKNKSCSNCRYGVGLEMNVGKTKYMVMSREENIGQTYSINLMFIGPCIILMVE